MPAQIEIEIEAEPGLAEGTAQESQAFQKPDPGSAEGTASSPDRERELLQLVVQLSKENGALQAMLNEREQAIKLLTDSQHKRRWWRQFLTWFLGQDKTKEKNEAD